MEKIAWTLPKNCSKNSIKNMLGKIHKISLMVSASMFLYVLGTGCSSTNVDSVKEYFQWIEEEKNGLKEMKKVGGLKVSVQYLPPPYLAYQELAADPSLDGNWDSLENDYSDQLSFMLKIQQVHGDKEKKRDLMMKDVGSVQDFKRRVRRMNFQIDEMVSLETPEGTYEPVLTSLENSIHLDKGKKLMLVFAPCGKDPSIVDSEEYELVFEDRIFRTGISHFHFEGSDMSSIPEFPIKSDS